MCVNSSKSVQQECYLIKASDDLLFSINNPNRVELQSIAPCMDVFEREKQSKRVSRNYWPYKDIFKREKIFPGRFGKSEVFLPGRFGGSEALLPGRFGRSETFSPGRFDRGEILLQRRFEKSEISPPGRFGKREIFLPGRLGKEHLYEDTVLRENLFADLLRREYHHKGQTERKSFQPSRFG